MRPHAPKPKKRAIEKALSTTIQSSFGWLRGFPSSERAWQPAPRLTKPDQPQRVLNRELLRSSQYALRSIPRRFPVALPRLYQSLDHWRGPIASRLSLIHGVIHEKKALPHWSLLPFPKSLISEARTVARAHPLNDQLIHALIWTYWDKREKIPEALSFLTQFQQALILISKYRPHDNERTFLKLFQIYQRLPHELSPIIRVLSQSEFWTLATNVNSIQTTVSNHLARLRHSAHFFSGSPGLFQMSQLREEMAGSPALGQAIIEQIVLFHRRDLTDQRSCLRLCQAMLPEPGLLDQWSQWWTRFTAYGQRLPQPGDYQRIPIQFSARFLRRLEESHSKLWHSKPAPYYPQRALSVFESATRHWHGSPAELFSRILPLLSNSDALKFVKNWWSELHPKCHSLHFIFNELLKFWGDQHGVENWKLWSGSSVNWLATDLWDLYNDDDRELSQREIKRLLAIVKRCLTLDLANPKFNQVKPLSQSWLFFQSLVHLDLSVNQIGTLASEISPKHRISYRKIEIQFYWALSQNNLCHFKKLMNTNLKRPKLPPSDFIYILKDHGPLLTLLRESLLGNHSHSMLQTLNKLSLYWQFQKSYAINLNEVWMESLGFPPSAIPAYYPQELRSEIECVLQFDPKAESSLKKILEKDYPNPEAIVKEISHLELIPQKAELAPKIALRLKQLKRRLHNTERVSTPRLERLRFKLLERIQWCHLTRLNQLLDAELESPKASENPYLSVIQRFGSSWIHVLRGIQKLSPKWRRLSEFILKRRLDTDQPCFDDLPQNAAFIAKMTQRSINLEPWLNAAPIAIVTENKETVSISIERDPLEIFLMGEHFSTCLSPFAINFFSVISNCVDVNKQVIYARAKSGVVKARCLIALNQSGQILQFVIYKHDDEQLTAPIRKYIEALAQLMNTSLASKGTVQKLVAPAWYDDGPTNPEDSIVRQVKSRIADLASTDHRGPFLETLEREFGTLTVAMASAIFQNRHFEGHPERYGPFFKAYPHWKTTPALQFQVLLWRDANNDRAQLEATLDFIEARKSWRDWSEEECLHLPRVWLSLGHPHKARRFLSQSQGFGRSWRDEYRFGRLVLWTEVFLALKRPGPAKEAYQRVVQRKDNHAYLPERVEKLRVALSPLLELMGAKPLEECLAAA